MSSGLARTLHFQLSTLAASRAPASTLLIRRLGSCWPPSIARYCLSPALRRAPAPWARVGSSSLARRSFLLAHRGRLRATLAGRVSGQVLASSIKVRACLTLVRAHATCPDSRLSSTRRRPSGGQPRLPPSHIASVVNAQFNPGTALSSAPRHNACLVGTTHKRRPRKSRVTGILMISFIEAAR